MEHIEKLNITGRDKSSSSGEIGKQKWAIVSISSIPLIMTLGNSMLIPVLTTMEKKLNISPFQASMIITVYSIVAILLIPVAGYISDHLGRKKVIIPSLIFAAIGGLISGFASWKLNDGYWLILVGRALQGVGAAGASPIVLPLIGDMFKDDEDVSSTLGLIETSNTLGKVLSPILGAFLAGFFWFLPFFAFPIFCTISIILMIFLVNSPKNDQKKIPFKEFFSNVKNTFTEKGRWLYAIFFVGAVLMFVLFGILFYLSDTFEKVYNIKDVKKGLFLAIPLGALCLSSYITGKIIKKNKLLMKWIVLVGIVLLAGSSALLIFSKDLWYLISMFVISGIGIGAGLPCLDALITAGIEKEERGTITSIYSSMRFIGVAAGPPIIAILMKHNEKALFFVLCGISILGAIITLFAIKPSAQKSH
ncbi:MFS transporter [Bacillus sp. CGMCC 1.16607]|uniref:MFS transporter n=1 Tax=Bacillus sp. CGMCC 1.16607 TaxID=3351842 RepID=UPI00362922FA